MVDWKIVILYSLLFSEIPNQSYAYGSHDSEQNYIEILLILSWEGYIHTVDSANEREYSSDRCKNCQNIDD